ncbi:MAG: flagellar filament outer layer protein FlaA [Spirochaetia bacterium]
MKRFFILLLLSTCLVSFTFAQQNQAEEDDALEQVGESDPQYVGQDTAQQALREVSVSRFEDAGFWYGGMPADEGIITLRRFEGEPAGKQPLAGEEEAGIEAQDRYVLGARVDFYKRGHNSFSIRAVRPLPVEGITKTISVWVAGRNYNHRLVLLIQDHFGNTAEIDMGTLNFSGWNQLTQAVPPNIVQRDYHYNNRMGIQIVGFRVECDPAETYGSYYIYFDDMRAVTDLFAEENRDSDDMLDTW